MMTDYMGVHPKNLSPKGHTHILAETKNCNSEATLLED